MKKRVWFLFILLGMFFIPKTVFGATFDKLYYFDSSFNVIGEYTDSSHTGNVNNVKYIRCSYTDSFIANYNYQLNFSYSIKGTFEWPYMVWNTAGLNVGGTYVKGAPDAQTIIDEEIVPPIYYYRQIVYPFAWKQVTGGNYPVFVQLELQNVSSIYSFSCDSFILSYTSDTGDNSDIINNQNINTQITVNNDNQNTQNIINNQNQIAQQQEENQKVCSSSDSSSISNYSDGYLRQDGLFISNTSGDFLVSDYIRLDTLTIITSGQGSGIYSCFYDDNKTLISCVVNDSIVTGDYNLPSGTKYFRYTKYRNKPTFKFSYCKNGNQALNDTLDGLLDHNTGGIDFTFGEIDTISDTPVTDLLLLPLELITKITTSLGSGCMSWDLPFDLWGNNGYVLHMPCINLETYLGSTVWGIIDDLCCILMIYNIFKMLLRFYESWSSLNDTFDDVVGGVK